MKYFFIFFSIFLLASCAKDKVSNSQNCFVPTTVSYSQDIKSILNQKCNNCHSYPGTGGIYLDSFQMVHDLAISGILLGSILSQPNFTAMPPTGYDQLDSCEIKNIQKWVAQGAPNN
jgi:mono/diheme cytochrome c family protein